MPPLPVLLFIFIFKYLGGLFKSWYRCYDFINISAEKNWEKWAFLTQNKAKLCKNMIITLFFEKNAKFLLQIGKNRRKL
jgi:hypothetical protein